MLLPYKLLVFVYTPQGDSNIPTSIFALIRWVSAPSEALIRQETDQTKTKTTTNEGCGCRWLCRLPTPGGVKPPLGRKVTTAEADHCRALGRRTQCYTKGHRECGEGCLAPDRLQWVGNGLTLFTADDYSTTVRSSPKGAAPANVSAIQKQARGPHPTESPRITFHRG